MEIIRFPHKGVVNEAVNKFLVHSTPSINIIMSNSSRAVTFVTVITTNKIYSPVLAQPGLAYPQAGRL